MGKSKVAAEVKAALRPVWTEGVTKLSKDMLLSTGSALLNLALSGRSDGGYVKGLYYHLVGDSSSGKTFFALTCLAEAAINPAFAGYRLIHDDSENRNMFDYQRFWPVLAGGRVLPARGTADKPHHSATVEEFYDNVNDALDAGPCVYVLDSIDALNAAEDVKKYEKQKAARRKRQAGGAGKDEAGTYGTAKAKENSTKLRLVTGKLASSRSILVIVSQTRNKIPVGFVPPGADMKTYGGGEALKFYASCQIWTSVKSPIRKRVRGKDRTVGMNVAVRVKKNSQTGGEHKIVVPYYKNVGIDDVGGCVDYLVDEGEWKVNDAGTITAPELEFRGKREEVVAHVQANGLEKKLRAVVKRVWAEIDAACTVERKPRYAVT